MGQAWCPGPREELTGIKKWMSGVIRAELCVWLSPSGGSKEGAHLSGLGQRQEAAEEVSGRR